MPSQSDGRDIRRRRLASFAVVIGGAVLALAVAPYAGRVNAALALALAIAVVGWLGGLRVALIAAVLELLFFSYFLAEHRWPGTFMPERFLPQLLLFGAIAFAAGALASRVREQSSAIARRAAEASALQAFTRDIQTAQDIDALIQALRSPAFVNLGAEIRLFLPHAGSLVEITPPPRDDAGLAAEAAEIAWLTRTSPHRLSSLTAVLIPGRTGPSGVLVAGNLTRPRLRRLSPAVIEALANLVALGLELIKRRQGSENAEFSGSAP